MRRCGWTASPDADSNYALAGELQDKETSTCLYSANPNLVRLLKDALANEIRLIEIEKKMLRYRR